MTGQEAGMASTAEWISAISTAVGTIVIIVAAAVAWRQFRLARSDREDRTRPFVVIDFVFPEDGNLIFLEIRNAGATMASDVTFEFDPELDSSIGKNDSLTPVGEWNVFKSGIPSLAPGRSIRFFFDNWIERKELPDRYDVVVRYSRDGSRNYEDRQVLDLGVYRHVLTLERRNIHHVHERLKEIVGILKGWGAFGGGLRTVSGEEWKERQEAWRADREELMNQSEGPKQGEESPTGDV